MAADIRARVSGLHAANQALRDLPRKLARRALRNALAAGARLVRDEARRAAPVLKLSIRAPHRRPGTLRKAITVRTSKVARRAGDVGVFVNVRPAKGAARGAHSPVDPYYWRWVNFGWSPGGGRRARRGGLIGRRLGVLARRRGAPVQGSRFMEAGARKLSAALAVFSARIAPEIAKLGGSR